MEEKWDQNNIVINNTFAFQVASDIIRNNEDLEPRNVEECRRRNDQPKWKETMQVELNSLTKRKVFGPVVQTPKDEKPVGYKWVFVQMGIKATIAWICRCKISFISI